jgi:hypothetical protein
MGLFVYALCALTSLACCVLLARHYRRSPGPLLLHSAIAFFCFAISNVLLFVDMILVPQWELKLLRNLITLVGVVILLTTLIHNHGKGQR